METLVILEILDGIIISPMLEQLHMDSLHSCLACANQMVQAVIALLVPE